MKILYPIILFLLFFTTSTSGQMEYNFEKIIKKERIIKATNEALWNAFTKEQDQSFDS